MTDGMFSSDICTKFQSLNTVEDVISIVTNGALLLKKCCGSDSAEMVISRI